MPKVILQFAPIEHNFTDHQLEVLKKAQSDYERGCILSTIVGIPIASSKPLETTWLNRVPPTFKTILNDAVLKRLAVVQKELVDIGKQMMKCAVNVEASTSDPSPLNNNAGANSKNNNNDNIHNDNSNGSDSHTRASDGYYYANDNNCDEVSSFRTSSAAATTTTKQSSSPSYSLAPPLPPAPPAHPVSSFSSASHSSSADCSNNNNNSVNNKILLRYRQSDVDKGAVRREWLASLREEFERQGRDRRKFVQVSLETFSSNFSQRSNDLGESTLSNESLLSWLVVPTNAEDKPYPPPPQTKILEVGRIVNNNNMMDRDDVDFVAFDRDERVDSTRATAGYNGMKAWDKIFSAIPSLPLLSTSQQHNAAVTRNSTNVLPSINPSNNNNNSEEKKSTSSSTSSSSYFSLMSSSNPPPPPPSLRKVFVTLIVDPSLVLKREVEQKWIDSVIDTMKSMGRSSQYNVDVVVDQKSGFGGSGVDCSPLLSSSLSPVVYYVMASKLDRDLLPPGRRYLEIGRMVSNRPDWDSVAISATDVVDTTKTTRSYDGQVAWKSIMERVASK